MKSTKLQTNAIIALLILAGLCAGFMFMLLVNDLTAAEHQAIVGLLAGCVWAIVHIAKEWAADPNEDIPKKKSNKYWYERDKDAY